MPAKPQMPLYRRVGMGRRGSRILPEARILCLFIIKVRPVPGNLRVRGPLKINCIEASSLQIPYAESEGFFIGGKQSSERKNMKHKTVNRIVLSGMLAFAGGINIKATDSKPTDIVVTATRVDTDIGKTASSMSVITSDQIDAAQRRSLTDILRDVPGVHISRNGGMGKATSIYLRGSKSEHILVMIDGVEVNDPMGIGRGADISDVLLDNVERVEVLRGPQSALYGSDAIGGVINIITKKGSGPMSASITAEAGSFGTYHETADIQGSSGDVSYSFSLSRIDSDGISIADVENGSAEKDGYLNNTLAGRFDWDASAMLSLRLFLRYIDTESDLDEAHGGLVDELNYVQETEQMFVRAEGDLQLMDSMWQQKFGASYSTHDRAFVKPDSRSDYDSDWKKIDWQNNLFLSDMHIVTAGAEYEEEQGSSIDTGTTVKKFEEQSSDLTGVFLQDIMSWDSGWTASASARLDDHDMFGSEFTYRLAPVYNIENTGTRLKATYGTGFKAPSLYQLYSTYGSPDLQPVKSKSFDIGVSQNLLSDVLVVDVTYFDSKYEDMISYDYATSKYGNISKATSKGVEVTAGAKVSDSLTLNASYTYTKTEDGDTGKTLKRVPQDRASIGAGYKAGKIKTNLSVVYVGKRNDMDFGAGEYITLSDYFMVDIAGAYDISEMVQVFARVENLLDEDYEEVYGYNTCGIGAYAGMKIRL